MPNPRRPRKVAFSNKKKKEQLKSKREQKRNQHDSSSEESDKNSSENLTDQTTNTYNIEIITSKVKQINQQPNKSNRFNLHFMKETLEDLKRHKKNASKELVCRNESELEIEIENVYKPTSPLDMPIRPKWSYEMTKEQLEQQEKNYYQKYLDRIFENFKQHELSYFEANLETWRQLWRVLEISDILLLIVDIRFPPLHFSPVFYDYCTKELKKDVILVLNKIDLVPSSVVIAWKTYFENKFPNLHILLFSSAKQIKQRRNKSNEASEQSYSDNQAAIKALSAEIYTAKAHRELYECVKKIVNSNVDLNSWAQLTENMLRNCTSNMNASVFTDNLVPTNDDEAEMSELFYSQKERKRYEHGYVTIGCCGFPNVGKSSLLNSLNGRKVVSVSRTPGHTKHLQTIFLTKNVRLCDCPGLVFPSLVEKPLQVLAGIYPIAQLQEPYSAIRYLSERVPVIEILKIKHPSLHNKENGEFSKDIFNWSPLDICEAWAIKRGYFTAKASRPDVYRAANELLRMALDGRICLSLKPKNYSKEKEIWKMHPETKALDEVVQNVEQTALANFNPKNHQNYANEEDDDDDDENEQHNFDEKILTSDENDEESANEEKTLHLTNAYSLIDDLND